MFPLHKNHVQSTRHRDTDWICEFFIYLVNQTPLGTLQKYKYCGRVSLRHRRRLGTLFAHLVSWTVHEDKKFARCVRAK